jgi:hypothetical protein
MTIRPQTELNAYRSFFGLGAGDLARPRRGQRDLSEVQHPARRGELREFSNLAAAVNYATSRPDVVAISISYGGSEFSGEMAYDSAYHHSGKAITVSSGDNGYGVEIPAASPFVTAVGGTSLHQASNTGGRTAGWFGERRREARQDRNGRAFAAVACVGDWPVLPTW